ncbi:MAG: hypothetical protein CFK52_01195 [Chloracidobacterium sp. CP2_5A]|nr:MAG: hypothetical protein CFK52_01195 [Chloracidobacterium sp. CP2_5A]
MPAVSDLAADLHALTARLAALELPDRPLHVRVETATESGGGEYRVAFAVAYGKLTVTCWGSGRSACWRVESYELDDDALRLEVSRRAGAESGRLVIAATGGALPDAGASPSPAEWRRRVRSWLAERLPPGTRIVSLPRPEPASVVTGWQAARAGETRLIFTTSASDEASLRRMLGQAALALQEVASADGLWLVLPPGGLAGLSPFPPLLRLPPLSLYEVAPDWGDIRPAACGHQLPLVAEPIRRWARRPPTLVELDALREWFGDDLDAHCEVAPLGARVLSVRWQGLECARWFRAARADQSATGSLRFGLTTLGEPSRPLTTSARADFQAMLASLRRHRAPTARDTGHPLYRAHPERWLDAVVRRRLEVIDDALDPAHVWAQSPHFDQRAAGLADFLTLTRAGRLAVVELKATADADAIWQALTYWLRAAHHWRQGDFVRRGYFAGAQLAERAQPALYLIAPTLRFHPVARAVARRLRPGLDLTLLGVNEGWRRSLRAVFRERFGAPG